MRILLDTAPFWWFATGSKRLSDRARSIFADPSNEILLSPILLWELLIKHQLGKLPTETPIEELIAKSRNERAIPALPLVDSAVVKLFGLPMLHRDPFDRLLICQAVDQGLTLLTPDEMVRAYPVPTIW